MREEGRERGNWVRRGAAIGTKARSRSARCFARSRSREASAKARLRSTRCFAIKIAIDASRDRDRHGASWDCDRRFVRLRSARCFARSRSAWRRDHDRRPIFLPLRVCESFFLSLSPFARLWAPLFARLSSRSDLKVK